MEQKPTGFSAGCEFCTILTFFFFFFFLNAAHILTLRSLQRRSSSTSSPAALHSEQRLLLFPVLKSNKPKERSGQVDHVTVSAARVR